MDKLMSVLPVNGGEMEFSAFVTAARSAGARPEMWRAAKQAGLLSARIDDSGVHLIRRVVTIPTPNPA